MRESECAREAMWAYLTTHLGPYHPPQHLSHTSLSDGLSKRNQQCSAGQLSAARLSVCVGEAALWLQSFNQPWWHQRGTNTEGEKERAQQLKNETSNKEDKNMRGRWGSIKRKWNKKAKTGQTHTERRRSLRQREHDKHDKHRLLSVHRLTRRQPPSTAVALPPPQPLMCPRTSFGGIDGFCSAKQHQGVGRRKTAARCRERQMKHKQENCKEVTAKLPAADSNAIEILSLRHF